jgi:two-component system, NarL family, sensor kinase
MTRTITCFLALFSLFHSAWGQNDNIDSLKTVLIGAKDNARIPIMLELCWEYRFVNADTARQYGMEALRLAREAELDTLEVEALHNIGITYEAQGDYSDALSYLEPALELRNRIGNDIKTANTLNNLGIVSDGIGDFTEALDYYYRALRIFEKANDKSKIAMMYTNIGIVHKERKDFKEAV